MTSGKPRLIVVGGPNGSGKTSITEQLLAHTWMQGCVYLNPDHIARDEFGDWNSQQSVLAAAQRAQELRETCLAQGTSLAIETVMSGKDKIDFLERARKAGYFIRLFFIATDSPAINARRVALRVLEGGHDVPIPKIISRYTGSISQCALAARIVDRLYVYDNSIEEATPRLLFRMSDGALQKQYASVNPWAQNILDAVAKT